jgi:hypothetical protein
MHCSFSRQVMMLLKMLMAVSLMVNLQNTSLCSITFTDVDYTYSLIKVLVICVIVFTVLGSVPSVFILFHLCIFIIICFVCTGVRTSATEWQLNCSNNNNNNNN